MPSMVVFRRSNAAIFVVPMIEVIDKFATHLDRSPPAWGELPVTHDIISQAIRQNALQSAPAKFSPLVFQDAEEKRDWHAGRIACLMKFGWGGEPITVNLQTVGRLGVLTVYDGYHRLWAAVMRGDRVLNMEVVSNVSRFKEWWSRDRP